ncbi:MAG: uncharacterized protein PWR01_1952 [Clostridiales bacterium]|nr:uncharacterized protein [Clostridiales bacterium]MDN5280879.1 uncharacterized protein [Candidatus Ozemobacter sp.]
MIKKIDFGVASPHSVFGNPAPLGLFGLAIACAALTPIAFGYGISETGINSSAFITAGIFCVLFGGFCQLITGIMDFANKNTYGGTIFTAFAFNWMITGISFIGVGYGWMIDHHIIVATEILMLVVFAFLTYGFGFFSKLLFFFLLDIDLLYVCKIIRGLTGTAALNLPIAIFTVLLGLIGLWLALAGLLNPLTGKSMFPVGGPMFFADRQKGFDWSTRRAIFNTLYTHWKEKAFSYMTIEELARHVKEQTGVDSIIHEVCYLTEYGALKTTNKDQDENQPLAARLTSGGVDLYEQLILRKYNF